MAKKKQDEPDDDIPEELVNKMMIACGRRCCICKRYRPTKLQVHHIQERARGGTHDEDNLIVTCFSCHSDVHTRVPFARRFTEAELKGHRYTLIKQVAEGRFPADDTDDTDEVIRSIVEALRPEAPWRPQLTHYAAEILLRAAFATGDDQGEIMLDLNMEGTSVQVNQQNLLSNPRDARLAAGYKYGLKQLLESGLVDCRSEGVYEVTYHGYLMADELKARGEYAFSE